MLVMQFRVRRHQLMTRLNMATGECVSFDGHYKLIKGVIINGAHPYEVMQSVMNESGQILFCALYPDQQFPLEDIQKMARRVDLWMETLDREARPAADSEGLPPAEQEPTTDGGALTAHEGAALDAVMEDAADPGAGAALNGASEAAAAAALQALAGDPPAASSGGAGAGRVSPAPVPGTPSHPFCAPLAFHPRTLAGGSPLIAGSRVTGLPNGIASLNLVNACYLNSLLKALAFITPLARLAAEWRPCSACASKPIPDRCFVCFLHHVLSVCRGESKPTHRFMIQARDRIIRSASTLGPGHKLYLPSREHSGQNDVCEAYSAVMKLYANGFLAALAPADHGRAACEQLLGGGVEKTLTTCSRCNAVSSRFNPFREIVLQTDPGRSSLQDLWSAKYGPQASYAIAPDHATDLGYPCTTCATRTVASAFCTIEDLPRVLTIQLGRHASHAWGVTQKTRHAVDLESSSLVFEWRGSRAGLGGYGWTPIKPGHRPVGRTRTFTLRSAIVHHGDSQTGHYFVFVQDGCVRPTGTPASLSLEADCSFN